LTEYVMSDYKDILQELDDGSINMEAVGFTEEELADLMTQFHQDEEPEKPESEGHSKEHTCPDCGRVFTD